MLKALVVMTALIVLLVPASAYAADVLNGVCGNGEATGSDLCQGRTSNNPIAGPNGLIIKITQIVALVAGVGAVIVIIISGFRYIMSNGDPSQAESARNALMYAIIGVVVIAAAESIISIVLSRI